MIEPARTADLSKLANPMRERAPRWTEAVARSTGVRPKIIETLRTPQRQDWLYGSGRPLFPVYGRIGPILTHVQGANPKAMHVSGKAFDWLWERPMDLVAPEDYGAWVWSMDRPWIEAGSIGLALGMTYIPATGSSFPDFGHLQWDH